MATAKRRTHLIVVWLGFVGLLLSISPRAVWQDVPVPATQNVCDGSGSGRASCHLLRRGQELYASARGPLAAFLNLLKGTAGLGRIVAAQQAQGYGPADIQEAYNLGISGGGNVVVAVVTAFDDPNAESDLATYRAFYGLPPCTSANGCFSKVNELGGHTPLPSPPTGGSRGWATEASVEIEMVSAACPLCRILLVEATDDQGNGLFNANLGAAVFAPAVVLDSWGTPESNDDVVTGAHYFKNAGIAVVAAGGNTGYGSALFPASLPYVTAVGGTSLVRADNARGWKETVWGSSGSPVGTGSGCSTVEPRPPYQSVPGCFRRTTNDVSAVADPATGMAAYATFGNDGGWGVYGGTDIAAAIIAGVYGLVTAHGGPVPQPVYLYDNPGALFDVTDGANGICGSSVSPLCTAQPGYDAPTGMGTPNGIAAFAPPPDDFAIALTPKRVRMMPGDSVNVSIATTKIRGVDQTLAFTAAPDNALIRVSLSAPTVTTGGSLTMTITADNTISQLTKFVIHVVAHGTAYHWQDYHVIVSPFPRPTATLKVVPRMIALSDTATLNWSSTDASSCVADSTPFAAYWHGLLPMTSGAQLVKPHIAGDHTYGLVCIGDGGKSRHKQVTLSVVVQRPIVGIVVAPATVSPGGHADLSWSVENATTCTAQGAWSGAEPMNGVETIVPLLPGTYPYTLKCTGPLGTTAATATLTVSGTNGLSGVN